MSESSATNNPSKESKDPTASYSKEQLYEYAKKLKLKIRKLEIELQDSKASVKTLSLNQTAEDGEILRVEIQSLEEQLQAKTTEIFRISKKNKELEDSCSQYIEDVNKSYTLVSQLQSDIQTRDKLIDQLERKVQDIQGLFENTVNERDCESHKVSIAEAEISNLKLLLQQQTNDDIIEQKNLSLSTEASTRETLVSLENSIQLKDKEISDLKSTIESSRLLMNKLESDLQKIQYKNDKDTASSRLQYETKLAEHLNQINELRDTLTSQTTQTETLHAHLSSTIELLENSKKEVNSKAILLEEAVSYNEKLKSEHKFFIEEFEKKLFQATDNIVHLKSENEDLKDRLNLQSDISETNSKEVDKLNLQVTQLTADKEQLSSELLEKDSIERQLTYLTEEFNTLKETYNSKCTELEALQNNNTTNTSTDESASQGKNSKKLNTKLKALQNKYSELELSVKQKDLSLKDQSSSIAEMQASIKSLQVQNDDLKRDKESLEQSISNMNANNLKSQLEVSDYQQLTEQLRIKCDELAEVKDKLNDIEFQLKSNADFTDSLKLQAKAYEEENKSLQMKSCNLESTLKQVQSDVILNETKSKQLISENESHLLEIKTLNVKLEQLSSSHEELQMKVNEYEKEQIKSLQTSQELEEIRNEVKLQANTCNELLSQNQTLQLQLDSSKSELESERLISKELQVKLSKAAQEALFAQQALEEISSEIQLLKRAMELKDEQLQQFGDETRHCKEELRTLQDSYDSKLVKAKLEFDVQLDEVRNGDATLKKELQEALESKQALEKTFHETFDEMSSKLMSSNSEKLALVSQCNELKEECQRFESKLETRVDERVRAANLELEEKHSRQVENLVEKIKRLKILLAKTKNSLNDKEDELLQLSRRQRPSKIEILYRIRFPWHSLDSEKGSIWCFTKSLDESVNTNQWLSEETLNGFVTEGTVIEGRQQTLLNQQVEDSKNNIKASCLENIAATTAELNELQTSFQAYKQRAQLALKRIGNDERNDRSLQDRIDQLQDQLTEATLETSRWKSKTEELELLISSMRNVDEHLEKQLQDLVDEKEVLASKLNQMLCQYEELLNKQKLSDSHFAETSVALAVPEIRSEETKEVLSQPIESKLQSSIEVMTNIHDKSTAVSNQEQVVDLENTQILKSEVFDSPAKSDRKLMLLHQVR